MLKIGQTGILIVALGSILGCTLNRDMQREEFRGLGRFEFRQAATGLEGVVIAAPHGGTDANSDRLARIISDRTGAGLAIAYGFKSRRLGVAQPLVRLRPSVSFSEDPLKRGSVFREYKRILSQAAKGGAELYIGVHSFGTDCAEPRIEVATSGLSFEQAKALKESYIQTRNQLTQSSSGATKLEMRIEPLDRITWRIYGVKHHGVLMVAKRGLNLRIPRFSSSPSHERLYAEILSRWAERSIRLLRENPHGLLQVQVRLMDLGRFELIRSREGWKGAVIGSPHGTFDEHTAEIVKQVSFHTGIASVIAKGFSPTQAGGWRINVNRPTEKTFPSEGFELRTKRAQEAYQNFRNLVIRASQGDLKLYIDIHQYNTDPKIQVATVGVTIEQARIIKMLYERIRDQALEPHPGIHAAELVIEPLDEVPIGAWAAKREGILGVAKKSLHFELPAQRTLETAQAREIYTRILADLFNRTVPFLLR